MIYSLTILRVPWLTSQSSCCHQLDHEEEEYILSIWRTSHCSKGRVPELLSWADLLNRSKDYPIFTKVMIDYLLKNLAFTFGRVDFGGRLKANHSQEEWIFLYTFGHVKTREIKNPVRTNRNNKVSIANSWFLSFAGCMLDFIIWTGQSCIESQILFSISNRWVVILRTNLSTMLSIMKYWKN